MDICVEYINAVENLSIGAGCNKPQTGLAMEVVEDLFAEEFELLQRLLRPAGGPDHELGGSRFQVLLHQGTDLVRRGPRAVYSVKCASSRVRVRYPSARCSASSLLGRNVKTYEGAYMVLVHTPTMEDPREYEACGVTKADRGKRTDEAMEVMRRLWHEDNVTHEGQFYTLHDVTVTPKPVQEPSLPVWVGGRSKAAQRRVGRVGDGWLVSFATPDEVAQGVEVVFETAGEYGRSVDEDHIGALIGFYIAPSSEEAEQRAEGYLTRTREDAHFTEYTALVPPDEVRALVQQYLEAGASKFVVRPTCRPEETLGQLELFGKEVLHHFHG